METFVTYQTRQENKTNKVMQKLFVCLISIMISAFVAGVQFNSLVAASTATVSYISSPITAPIIITPSDPTPTPTSVPSNSGSSNQSNNNNSSGSNNNGSSNNSGSSSCSDTAPKASPKLYQIITTNTKATLFVTPPAGNVTAYTVSYGTKAANLLYNATLASVTKGSVQLAINLLKPNTTYYFSVKAVNGCATGPTSNMLKATTLPRPGRSKVTTAWEQTRAIVLSWLR